MSNLKKYISPLASIFFFLSLVGCGNDEETLIVLIYTIYFGGRLLLLFGVVGVVYGVFLLIRAVVRWVRRAKEKRQLLKAKGEILHSLSLMECIRSSGRSTVNPDIYEWIREQKENDLHKINVRLAEFE